MSSSPFNDHHLAMVRSLLDRRQGYDDAAVSDAKYMMEALHGENAAMTAVAIACDRLLDDKVDETRFWMRVYRAIAGIDTPQREACVLH
ncbi:hypothetical protein [Acuticoccus sp.]|uniref:hypothetical protein n=1 Tax=Acuticoccus sp. TaxID=1904378 RepID=UPI003B51E295